MRPLVALAAAVGGMLAPAAAAPPVSPAVHSDGTVTFQFREPFAHEVELVRAGAASARPMRLGAGGVWTLTEGPLAPDFYGYAFIVDGTLLLDPSNPRVYPNLESPSSVLHVPGPRSLPWETNSVPRGAIDHRFYRSEVAGAARDFYVYTPPGYDPRGGRRYPVLYLLHGYTDDASCWTAIGRANVILDNLIARGRAQPMIVVMPFGYGTMDFLAVGETRAFGDHAFSDRNYRLFQRMLTGEVMPRVEAEYRTEAGRENRAIAGLSMGGAESLWVGFRDLRQFAWIGAFSAAIGAWHGEGRDDFDQAYPTAGPADNAQLRLLWIACGAGDTPHIGPVRRFCGWLDRKGVRYTQVETPGAHTWMVWRRNLAAFAPLLFRHPSHREPSAP